MMLIDKKLLDEVTERAKGNERLRMTVIYTIRSMPKRSGC